MKTNRTQIQAKRFGCLLAVILSAAAAGQAATRITSVTGAVTLFTAAGESRPASVGDVLQPGDSIFTSYDSEAELESEGASVLLQENGSLSESDGDIPETITLNYGIITGEVPPSAAGMFSIYTPLGVPEIHTGSFMVNNIFNVERQEMILQVKNMGGRVMLRSRYAGTMEYGRYSTGDKNYNGAMTEETAEIPPEHLAIIRLRSRDPYFFDRVDYARNMPTETMEVLPDADILIAKLPILTPEDPGTQVVSPSDPAQ